MLCHTTHPKYPPYDALPSTRHVGLIHVLSQRANVAHFINIDLIQGDGGGGSRTVVGSEAARWVLAVGADARTRKRNVLCIEPTEHNQQPQITLCQTIVIYSWQQINGRRMCIIRQRKKSCTHAHTHTRIGNVANVQATNWTRG